MATTPCANCGNALQPTAAFCGVCGTAAPPAGAAAPPSAPPDPPPAPPATGAPPAHGAAPTPTPGMMPPPPGPPTPPPYPSTVPPVHGRPAVAAPAVRPPASGRNVAAGVLALVGALVVFVGTFLPIIEFDFGGAGTSSNGWGDGLNDGPIHTVFLLIPLVMGILSLSNRARVVVKVLLLLSALIGFFWVVVRFADISGSLEDDASLSAFVAEAADPGAGLFLILGGWVLVLVAGIVAKAGKPRPAAAPYGQPYPGAPAA